jgi:hypothetical protein
MGRHYRVVQFTTLQGWVAWKVVNTNNGQTCGVRFSRGAAEYLAGCLRNG